MKYIITERQLKNLRVRRNIFDELPKYVTSTFKWLNPKAFNNFDEFIERVIFSTTRDYVGEFIDGPEEFDDLTNMIEPTVRDMVMGRYYDEILDYYNNHFKT
jgi:hypothetical protein